MTKPVPNSPKTVSKPTTPQAMPIKSPIRQLPITYNNNQKPNLQLLSCRFCRMRRFYSSKMVFSLLKPTLQNFKNPTFKISILGLF